MELTTATVVSVDTCVTDVNTRIEFVDISSLVPYDVNDDSDMCGTQGSFLTRTFSETTVVSKLTFSIPSNIFAENMPVALRCTLP